MNKKCQLYDERRTKGLQDMKPDSDVLVYVLSLILYKMMMMNMMCCSCTMYDDDDVYLC